MYFRTTTLTKESRLTTIGPRYVSTSTTFLTRVASIYKGNTFPKCFSFVGKEALKLIEWPVANPLIHLLPSLLFADTRKVFKFLQGSFVSLLSKLAGLSDFQIALENDLDCFYGFLCASPERPFQLLDMADS